MMDPSSALLDLATYLLTPCGLALAWYLFTYPTN